MRPTLFAVLALALAGCASDPDTVRMELTSEPGGANVDLRIVYPLPRENRVAQQ